MSYHYSPDPKIELAARMLDIASRTALVLCVGTFVFAQLWAAL